MRVLLDECLPRRLIRDLHGHEVTTVPRQGWNGKRNGELLSLAQDEFDVFVTLDSSLEHQQNLTGFSVCVMVLHAVNSRYETLAPLVPRIREELSRAAVGTILHVQ